MTPEGSHVYSIFAAGPSWDIRGFLPQGHYGILVKLCRQGHHGHNKQAKPKGFSKIKMTPEGSHVYSIFAAGPSWDIRGFLPQDHHGVLGKLCRQGHHGQTETLTFNCH
jgi:hypothetical protein